MCGIFGLIGNNNKVEVSQVIPYLNHRGPDDSGVYNNTLKNVSLAFTRLSIIDLSENAHQPMVDETKNFVIVFNGEVYNYKEIKDTLVSLGHNFSTNSDTEVVLKSYIQWGENCAEKFRGMFAFAIFNNKTSTLFIARDRFGIKPIYYSFYNNTLIFASELKPIVNINIVPPKISKKGLADFQLFGSVQQPNTIYENVFALMPSTYMVVDTNDLKYEIKKYYNYESNAFKYQDYSFNDAIKSIRNTLEEATQYHLISDVDVGAFLSGGIDSTAVVALMSKYLTKPINTFTLSFPTKTEVEDEGKIAKYSAEQLNCNHHDIKVYNRNIPELFDEFIHSLDQPSIDGFNTFIVSKEASKHVKVVLSGLGGDEIFAGYNHFYDIANQSNRKPNLLEALMIRLNRMRPNRFTSKYKFFNHSPYNATIIQRSLDNKSIPELKDNFLSKCDLNHLSPIQQISKAEIDNYLLNTLLRDSDTMSMANSLELRPVLLDHILVESVFSMPDKYKIKNGVKKAIFIEAVKDLIPKEVWNRKKSGFEMPYKTWMNNILRDRVERVLHNKTSKALFNQQFLSLQKSKLRNNKVPGSFWKDLILIEWINNSNAYL